MPLAEDGIHDPTNPAFELLQEPADALMNLPVDINGMTDWVKTLQNGHIAPRKGVTGKEKMKVVDLDITMKNTASMPHVMFSHQAHTQWLTCSNCHSRIFLPQIGGNFITMAKIVEGEYCGVCHGKVAFTALDCERCHTVPNKKTGLR
ncbi:MAG: c(7)-type cytochrome triheme domain-containing protein [Pseudomonadota bacterium]